MSTSWCAERGWWENTHKTHKKKHHHHPHGSWKNEVANHLWWSPISSHIATKLVFILHCMVRGDSTALSLHSISDTLHPLPLFHAPNNYPKFIPHNYPLFWTHLYPMLVAWLAFCKITTHKIDDGLWTYCIIKQVTSSQKLHSLSHSQSSEASFVYNRLFHRAYNDKEKKWWFNLVEPPVDRNNGKVGDWHVGPTLRMNEWIVESNRINRDMHMH